jgi:hypothetical protein
MGRRMTGLEVKFGIVGTGQCGERVSTYQTIGLRSNGRVANLFFVIFVLRTTSAVEQCGVELFQMQLRLCLEEARESRISPDLMTVS